MGKVLEDNPHVEPCLSCGEETAIGSIFFSDRKVVEAPDGSRAYLCSECVARIRESGHGAELADARTVGDLAMLGLNSSLPG